MKNKRKTSPYVAVMCVFIVLMSSSAFGWGKKTHKKLIEHAVEKSREAGWLEP